MGICLGKMAGGATTSPPCWPDLPSDITGLVLARLGSHDRLSFAAVCREWRLVAQLHRTVLPPAFPCINLGDGAYQSISDGEVRQFAKPIHGYVLDASFGSYLVRKHEGSGHCFMCDPFSPSMPAVKIPCRYMDRRADRHLLMMLRVKKIIILSPHLVVTMFKAHTSTASPTNFAWFRMGAARWSDPDAMSGLHGHANEDYMYKDIEVHCGKIYAVGWRGHLFAMRLLTEMSRLL